MTDNEIIKALGFCDSYFDCDGCPCGETCGGLSDLSANAIDLIKRKDAEIERLKTQLATKYKWENMLDKQIKEVKSEAIKAFAERLKKELMLITANGGGFVPSIIDNLVKEMTEKGGEQE